MSGIGCLGRWESNVSFEENRSNGKVQGERGVVLGQQSRVGRVRQDRNKNILIRASWYKDELDIEANVVFGLSFDT